MSTAPLTLLKSASTPSGAVSVFGGFPQILTLPSSPFSYHLLPRSFPFQPENLSGTARGKILIKVAELIEENVDELASLEALDNGKAFSIAKGFDIVEGA